MPTSVQFTLVAASGRADCLPNTSGAEKLVEMIDSSTAVKPRRLTAMPLFSPSPDDEDSVKQDVTPICLWFIEDGAAPRAKSPVHERRFDRRGIANGGPSLQSDEGGVMRPAGLPGFRRLNPGHSTEAQVCEELAGHNG
jgi:hypothetical protein